MTLKRKKIGTTLVDRRVEFKIYITLDLFWLISVLQTASIFSQRVLFMCSLGVVRFTMTCSSI